MKRWVVRVLKEAKLVGKRGFMGGFMDWEMRIEIAENRIGLGRRRRWL